MRSIRGGKGLGDALYVQAVARALVKKERLQVATSWPDVFRPLGDAVECVPFRKHNIDVLAHYCRRKYHQGTDQFLDVCREAGLKEPAELKLDWQVRDRGTVDGVLSRGRPVVLVQLPRAPMGRTDGFGMELLPDCRAIQRVIDRLAGRAHLVQVGSGEPLFRFRGIDQDLANQTTVSQLLDLASVCAGVVGYVSFILPLAESLGKPGLLVWSRKGLKSPSGFIRQITPAKVVHRKDLVSTVLDGLDDDVEGAADAFLR